MVNIQTSLIDGADLNLRRSISRVHIQPVHSKKAMPAVKRLKSTTRWVNIHCCGLPRATSSLFPGTPWLAVKESLSAQPEACRSCSHSDRSVAKYFEIALDENVWKREKLEGRRRPSGVTHAQLCRLFAVQVLLTEVANGELELKPVLCLPNRVPWTWACIHPKKGEPFLICTKVLCVLAAGSLQKLLCFNHPGLEWKRPRLGGAIGSGSQKKHKRILEQNKTLQKDDGCRE